MVENPPANAEDTGSNPGLGGSHVPWSDKARAPQLLSLRSGACEPQLLKPARLEPMLCNGRSHHNERPAHRRQECPPLATTGGGPRSSEDPRQPKINK